MNFKKLLYVMDQPSIDGVNTYFVCMLAAEAGLKVALSGVGGDELFAGYGEFVNPNLIRLAAISSRINGLGLFVRRISGLIRLF